MNKEKCDIQTHTNISLKKSLPYATIWMNHEEIKLSQTSQSENDKYSMIPLT